MVESVVESRAEISVDSIEKSKIRVLHVDDEIDLLKVAKECLETQGLFHVDSASSVREAMQKLKEEAYDAVVSDYQMLGKDGLQFLRELRANRNSIPFIIFTGKGKEKVAIEALNLGANQYLSKTGDPATIYCELAHGIQHAVEKSKAEEEPKESEEKYRELFESIQDPVCIYVGKEGHLVDYNAAFKKLFGYTDEELKGKIFLDFVHSDDQIMVTQKYQTRHLAEEFPIVYEIRGINKKGESIPIEISVSEYKRKGRVIGVEVVHRCVIERKRYERSLSELNIYSEKLNAAKSMQEIYELTLDAAEKTLGFEFADILTIKEKKLCLATHRGHSKISSLELPLDGDKGVTARVARTGEPVFVPDISKDEAYVEGGLHTRSELAVPIKIGQKIVGVLNAEKKEVNAFDEKDQKLLEILASHAAAAISNLDHAKKLEENAREIRENQRKLERLFVNIPEASVYTDSNLHILEINPRFSELFGYNLDEVKGKSIDDVVVPRNKMDEAKMLGEELVKGRAHCETARQRKDGTLVPVSISVAPIIVEDQPIGYVGLYSDITERKRYEERLSALNIYSYSLNMAGSIEEIYGLTLDAMQKVLGFEYADFFMIEGNMLRIVDQRGYPKPFPLELPLDGSKKGISIRAVMIGNSVSVQDVRISTDFVEGLPCILSELAVPVKIGQKILGVLNVESKELSAFDERDQALLEILASHAATAISNLDRAKKLEENAREIRESQQKFEGLFMASPEAAVHVGPDICILNVNPRFEMLFGYKLDEIKGKNINDVVVPKDKIDEAQMLDRIAEQEKHVSQNTVRRKKDGSLVPVFVSSAPITIEGRFFGYVAVYKDISQLENAEKNLKLMNEKLRVTGGLTRHDVRNKLSTVAGNVYLLKKRLADNSDMLDKLKAIENAVQQTVRIFDFAKAYEMLGAEELSYVDVAKTFDEAVSLFPGSMAVKVLNDCHGLVVLADPLLRQLLYNLVDNSLKYGQKVSTIKVRYETTGPDNLSLVYEDDGVGIPASEKPNLFKEGYSTGGSTGYGLYLISKIVEVYGWKIQETGTPGAGVQFTLAIPKVNKDGKEGVRFGGLVRP